jgi:hypothetical protein
MCYPDAEVPMEKFFEAHEKFEKDLHDILIFGTRFKERYIRIYSETSGSQAVWVYLQRSTNKVVKIIINSDMSEQQYNKDPVDILAEDVNLLTRLNELDSVKSMRENAAIVREIIYEDQIMVALKYNIERVSIFKPK